MHVVIIPGTNRRGSFSGQLATLITQDYLAHGCSVDVLTMDLGPEFLDPDAYRSPAPAVSERVARFMAADGVVMIVPEYNGSFPGVLKLFIDMLPYPHGLEHRPCAFIGLAAGQFQSLRAVEHLQSVTGYRHAYQYPVRVFIGDSKRAFTSAGQLVDPALATRLTNQAAGFVRFISQVKHTPHG